METRLEIPKNWQDFEMLCHRLWRDIWGDANAQQNGRRGQGQNGVDIWGRPAYRGYYAGVQCKDKDGKLGSELTKVELDAECEKASKFEPRIEEFSMATTAARDAALQQYAREISHAQTFPFSVHVWSWDDIEEEVKYRPDLLEAYYPKVSIDGTAGTRVILSLVAPRDQCHAFFSRPQMQHSIPPTLREFLVPLCYELSDNAYRHGKATYFSITCSEKVITLEDNGIAFDPIHTLDSSKVSNESHVGSYVFEAFCREFEKDASVTYERFERGGSLTNKLTLTFQQSIATLKSEAAPEIVVKMALASGRIGAERLAASIPIPVDTKTLVLDISDFYNISALVEFLQRMLKRLPAEMNLLVYLPRLRLLENLTEWFKDQRLSINFR